jgi:hypothetical protein
LAEGPEWAVAEAQSQVIRQTIGVLLFIVGIGLGAWALHDLLRGR